MNIKNTLIAIALSTSVSTAMAGEDEKFSCITESGSYLSLEVDRAGTTELQYLPKTIDSPLQLTANDDVHVAYGHTMFNSGESTYVRFTYFSDDNVMVSWVVLDGEVPLHSFQGIRAFHGDKLVFQDECSSYVSARISKGDDVTEEQEMSKSIYGNI